MAHLPHHLHRDYNLPLAAGGNQDRSMRMRQRPALSAAALTQSLALPRLLSLLLLGTGLLLAMWVPLAGAPPPQGTLLGQPGLVRTFNPQLRQLESNIANRHTGQFEILLSQQDLDAELAWQLNRLKGKLPFHDAFIQPGDGALDAGGVVSLGPVSLPASVVLAVAANGCDPVVEIRQIAIGGSATPEWLKARADALMRQKLAEALDRGLGFCLTGVTFRPGQIVIDGRVEGKQP
jgi:hypothetical protein